jgi:predicted amidohydrolase YtcJ
VPSGGEIVKDAAGQPTGVLVDNAGELVKAPPTPTELRRRQMQLAVDECLRKGVTSFHDAGVPLGDISLYKGEAAAGRLPLRLYVMAAGLSTMQALGAPEVGLGNGMLTIRAVKLVGDGAMGSRGAALLEPYEDDPGNSGFFTTPPEEVLEAARFGLKNGFQVNVHAIGDRTNRMVLDTFQKAFAEFPNVTDPRFRIEHAQILDEREIPRFARLGVIASMQGIHCTSDRPWAASRIGEARVAEGLYVWQKLLRSGARIMNGTDVPVEDVDPVKNFYASVTREKEDGTPRDGFDPAERMSREEALRSMTLEVAYGAFEEKIDGSIVAGKRADLTVLSRDIMTVPEDEILGARVLYTIVDGRVRFRR